MVICPKCGYAWQTKSTADMICCPSCQRKFVRPAPVVEVLGRIPLSTSCDACGSRPEALNCCRVDGEAAYLCDACLPKNLFSTQHNPEHVNL